MVLAGRQPFLLTLPDSFLMTLLFVVVSVVREWIPGVRADWILGKEDLVVL